MKPAPREVLRCELLALDELLALVDSIPAAVLTADLKPAERSVVVARVEQLRERLHAALYCDGGRP